jgi:hypothetical protein
VTMKDVWSCAFMVYLAQCVMTCGTKMMQLLPVGNGSFKKVSTNLKLGTPPLSLGSVQGNR